MGRKHNDVFVIGAEALGDEPPPPRTPLREEGEDSGTPPPERRRLHLPRIGHDQIVWVVRASGVLLAVATALLLHERAGSSQVEAPPSPAASQIAAAPPPSPVVSPGPIEVRPPRPRPFPQPRLEAGSADPVATVPGPPSVTAPAGGGPAAAPVMLAGTTESFGFERPR
jgi:hypothetical protein